jgi:hypothetical protein
MEPKPTLEVILQLARANLENDGDLMPVLFVRSKKGMEMIGIADFAEDAEKRQDQFFALGCLRGEDEVQEIYFVADSFLRDTPDDPNPREAIVVSHRDVSGSGHLLTCTYERKGTFFSFLQPEFKDEFKGYLLDAFFEGIEHAQQHVNEPKVYLN